jgi:predicted PurR-regulated permease PerM
MPQDTNDPGSKTAQPAAAGLRLLKNASEQNELLTNVASGLVAQIVVAVAAVLAICYVAKLPLITLMIGILLAFILTPLVDRLERWRVPRPAGSFIAVVLLLACLYGVAYFSYNRAVEFIDQLPTYSQKIRNSTLPFRRQAEKIQESTEAVMPTSPNNEKTVRVKQQSDLSDWITGSFGGITEAVLSLSFIPFLTYFMLTWKNRTRDATVRLFDPENRLRAHAALCDIADMLRAFLVGNLICGLFMAAVSVVFFGFLKLPYFYFLGLISGFLSLIPYLGVFLAVLPPLAAGLGQISGAAMIALVIMIVALHVFGINVLIPKVIGKRVNLNPLAVTIALLMWGWIWGAVGLILAVPITAAVKIVFDHVHSLRPFGAWMEE